MTEIEKKIAFVDEVGKALYKAGVVAGLSYDVFLNKEYGGKTEFLLVFSIDTGELISIRCCTGDSIYAILQEIAKYADSHAPYQEEFSFYESIENNPMNERVYS